MDQDFIRRRITELRTQKGVSEYKMSMDLGHNKSYLAHISAGRTLPSLPELFYICEYLEVSLSDFFDESTAYPILVQQAVTMLKELTEDDLLAMISLMKRLQINNETRAV